MGCSTRSFEERQRECRKQITGKEDWKRKGLAQALQIFIILCRTGLVIESDRNLEPGN